MAGGINPFGFAVSAPQPAPRAPIDLPSAPFGFAPPPSKWEQTAAILNEYNPIDAFWRLYNSDMAKGGAITDQNIEDGMMVGGTVMGGGAMIPKPANALNMGIRAYHGSPHSFDKFSMDKIGTGEGAQAYGHGLYFAESEGVANAYKDALRRRGDKITFDGKPLEQPRDFTEIQNKLENDEGDWRLYKAVEEITARQGDMTDRLSDIRNWYRNQPEMLAAIDRAEQRMSLNANPGSMYEVNIDADPNADFINFDAPWSGQPQKVKDAFHYLSKNQPDGSDLARRIEAPVFAREASDRGVKGIQYLDAGSRYTPANLPNNPIANEARQFLDAAQGNGERALQLFRDSNPVDRWAGPERDEITKVIKAAAKPVTRNYVVFDDKLISIIRKYGIAGASAMLGYNLLENVNPVQADELKRIEAGK